jgi:hypothetical protein
MCILSLEIYFFFLLNDDLYYDNIIIHDNLNYQLECL